MATPSYMHEFRKAEDKINLKKVRGEFHLLFEMLGIDKRMQRLHRRTAGPGVGKWGGNQKVIYLHLKTTTRQHGIN